MLIVVAIALAEVGIGVVQAGWTAWLLAITRRERGGRHAAQGHGGRRAASPPVDHESYAEPELTGLQRSALAGIVSWAEAEAGPAAIANGVHLAEMIRLDDQASDLGAAGVLLHLVTFSKHLQELPEAALSGLEPAEMAGMVGDAIAAAVYELTALHRATA